MTQHKKILDKKYFLFLVPIHEMNEPIYYSNKIGKI